VRQNSGLARPSELFDAIKARLAASEMLQNTLRGRAANPEHNRVYLSDDDYSLPDGPEGTPWGRLVVMPPTTPWDFTFSESALRPVSFLVKVEYANYTTAAFRPRRAIEAAHVEAFALLHGWVPTTLDGAPFRHLLVGWRIYRVTDPQPMPFWDAERSLWYSTCEYRTQITSAPTS
jgi:hypothetical protein